MDTREIDIRKCGGIITNPKLDSVVVVMNRHSAWKKEFKWGLPKGHRRDGESCQDCAQREIEEEIGIAFPPLSFRRTVYLNGNCYYVIILEELAHTLQTNDSKEISEVRWMSLKELRSSNYNSDVKRFLKVFPNNRVEFTKNHHMNQPHHSRNRSTQPQTYSRQQKHPSSRNNTWPRNCKPVTCSRHYPQHITTSA